jgi:hypothetical protein
MYPANLVRAVVDQQIRPGQRGSTTTIDRQFPAGEPQGVITCLVRGRVSGPVCSGVYGRGRYGRSYYGQGIPVRR